MHCAKAIFARYAAVSAVEAVPPLPAEGELHAVVSKAAAARAAMAIALRAPKILLFIALSLTRLLLRLYRMGGDSTVTGNVTWLSPVTCDLGRQARL
jgi:hypothetical protein